VISSIEPHPYQQEWQGHQHQRRAQEKGKNPSAMCIAGQVLEKAKPMAALSAAMQKDWPT